LDLPGIEVNVKDDAGRTPLQLATEKGYEEAVELLKAFTGIV
jgi:ankyrin repeat protein